MRRRSKRASGLHTVGGGYPLAEAHDLSEQTARQRKADLLCSTKLLQAILSLDQSGRTGGADLVLTLMRGQGLRKAGHGGGQDSRGS